MKKISITFACLLASSMSYATIHPFTGAYVDAGLGGVNGNYLLHGNRLQQSVFITETTLLPNNGHLYANSFLGTVGVGFTQCITPLYVIGWVANANFFDASVGLQNNFNVSGELVGLRPVNQMVDFNVKSRIDLDNSYDLLIKAGRLLDSSTLLYLLMGVTEGHFHTSQTSSYTVAIVNTILNQASSSRTTWQTGFTVGVGVQQSLFNNFSGSLEYAFTDYGHIHAPGDAAQTVLFEGVPSSLLSQTSNIKAYTNTVSLKLFYAFDLA